MLYVIMCGGFYEQWETPKQLQIVNGERIVERTIRLLKENGVKDIVITSNNPVFDELGVPRLEHENSYRYENGKLNGYWLDAFYPKFRKNQKATFIFGDVYFTEDAIKQIVEYKGEGNVLFGSRLATNLEGKNYGEPFAYVVNDMGTFYEGIKAVKKLQDEGKTKRVPIVWELYRYLNGLDVNVQRVLPETFIVIDDETDDADSPEKLKRMNESLNKSTEDIFYFRHLNKIGGVETFFYNMARKYGKRNITIYYNSADEKQLGRLEQIVRVKKYNGEQIKCRNAYFNYQFDIIDNVKAENYYLLVHKDYKVSNDTPYVHPKINGFIAVSETAAKAFEEQTGRKAKVLYNPFVYEEPQRCLFLISATRLTKEKGEKRMKKLAKALDDANISYLWIIFSNYGGERISENVVYTPQRLDIRNCMVMADWFVQLSDYEAYCYSVVESLSVGTPVIVTDCPVFKEIGVNEKNGITLPFDMEDIPIDKIVKGLPPFKYEPPKDEWDKILTKAKTDYIPPKEEDLLTIKIVTNKYYDNKLDRSVYRGEELTVTRKRLKEIQRNFKMQNSEFQFDIIRELRND